MGFLKRRGRSKEPSTTKSNEYIFLEPPTTTKTPQSPQMTSSIQTTTQEVNEMDPLTAKVASVIHSVEKDSREPMSVAQTVQTGATRSTIVASDSGPDAESIDPVLQRESVPRSILIQSKSPSRRSHRTGKSQSPSRLHRNSRSRSPSLRSHRSTRSISPSLRSRRSTDTSKRKSRSTTPRRPRRITTTYVNLTGSSYRKSRSLTPRSLHRRSSTPKSMSTMIVGYGSQRGKRSIRIESPSSRSRSVELSMRKSRSLDASKSRGKSEEPKREAWSPRSMARFLRFSPSAASTKYQTTIQDTRTNDTADTTKDGLLLSRTRSSEMVKNPNPVSSWQMLSMANLIEATPFHLGKDMTYLADGMNLDRNTRYLLAAFDARTIDDFYLMSDSDFSNLIQKAKSTKNELPPLQIRKVKMLRAWLKEVVDDHLNDDSDSSRGGRGGRKRSFRIVPKDWKEQYKNDLPHLKLQLRHQGDSLFEKLKNLSETLVSCGAGSCY